MTVPTAPVLLLGFNRPDKLEKVIEATRAATPSQVFLAVDGPRPGHPTDRERVDAVVRSAERLDWGCEVKVLAQPHNLGCGRAVAAGITWFFSEVPAGIVLEDDCLPSPSFFRFCSELLERHLTDSTTWMISGFNYVEQWRPEVATHFRAEGGAWGWATWADRWQHFDPTMAGWGDFGYDVLERLCGSNFAREMRAGYDGTAAGLIDTWDYQWSWTRLSRGGSTLVPSKSLITNIGAGLDSTHAFDDGDLFVNTPRFELDASGLGTVGDEWERAYLDAAARKMARNRRRVWRRSVRDRARRRLLPNAWVST